MTDRATEPLATRRAFLAGAVATATLAMADPVRLAAARQRAAALPAGDLFPLGVASGDPTAEGAILWTRIVSPDPSIPLGPVDLPVLYQVATDPGFGVGTIVATGTVPAVAELAHSVHLDLGGLDPATEYWYRFQVDARTSQIGRAHV